MRAGRLKAEAVETKNSTRALAIIRRLKGRHARSVGSRGSSTRQSACRLRSGALSSLVSSLWLVLLIFSRTAFRLYAHYNTHASHTCRELARSAAYKVVPIIPFPTTTQVLQSKDTFYPRVARVHSTIVCGGHEHFDRRVAIIRHRLSDLSVQASASSVG